MVTQATDSGAGSLREAVAAATNLATITFASSLAGQTITLLSTVVLDKSLTIDASALAEPVTISDGGAVRVLEVPAGVAVTLDGLVIADGWATVTEGERYVGGGIANWGTLTVTDCAFTGNSAMWPGPGSVHGGALFNEGIALVSHSTFTDNVAQNGGGGIASLEGTLTVESSTFSDNSAFFGGGIVASEASVGGCTSTGNSAANMSGGIFVLDGHVENSTFLGNSADFGGGILGGAASTVTLTHCTFSGNTVVTYLPGYGGGGILHLGPLHYTHTVIANSPADGDCRSFDGAQVAGNIGNLVEDGGCGAALTGDPLLGPLADHGGPTQTMALLTGSPALNAGGTTDCAPTNQRGVARP